MNSNWGSLGPQRLCGNDPGHRNSADVRPKVATGESGKEPRHM